MGIRSIYITIMLIIAICFTVKEKNWINPILIFNSIWIFVFLCAMKNPLVDAAKNSTYDLFFVAIIMFDFGCVLAKFSKVKKIKYGTKKIDLISGNYVIRKRLIWFLIIVTCIYNLINLVFVFSKVGNFNFANVMVVVNTEDVLINKSKILNFLYTLVINPFSYVSSFIVATDYWVGTREKKLLYSVLIMQALRLFSSGNRLSIISTFIFLILVGLFTKKMPIENLRNISERIEWKKRRRIILLLVFIAVIIFIYATISRGYSVKENVFINFAIPLRMFEIWAEKIKYKGAWGLGFASLEGIIYPIFYILKNIIGIPMPTHILEVYNNTTMTVTQWVSGGTYSHNAYVSIFWYFYYDFRTIGIVLLSFIFGYFSCKSYKKALLVKNVKSIVIYCMFIKALIGSYANMSFSVIPFGVGLVLLLFLLYKKQN